MSVIRCSKCKIQKHTSHFRFISESKGKIDNKCKECRNYKTPPEYFSRKKKEALGRFIKIVSKYGHCSICGDNNVTHLNAYGYDGNILYYYKLHSEEDYRLIKHMKCANCAQHEKMEKLINEFNI